MRFVAFPFFIVSFVELFSCESKEIQICSGLGFTV